MELRTLKYFLEIAREENMSRAAERLDITQSALSKQIKALEEELGKALFIRHSSSIELTEEGVILRKRAEDIISMASRITEEFSAMDEVIGGNIYFGAAETYNISHLAAIIRNFRKSYPAFHYHITSGDTEQVTEKLDKGLLDFAMIVEEPNWNKYNAIKLPFYDRWGLVMPSDSELAVNDSITFEDLKGIPLFCSGQGWHNDITRWCGERIDELHLEGSFRLSFNASIFVKEGLGYLLTFENLVNTSDESGLCFRPLYPALTADMYIIWRKRQIFTPIAERFMDMLEKTFKGIQ